MPESTIKKPNMVEAINQALDYEMGRDNRVICLGEDVGENGGVFRVTEGLWKKYGPERCFNTPLSEAGIVGASIGMAIMGLRPVPEIQFDGFIWPGFDHLVSHASRIRTRSRGRFSCPLTLRVPYGGGIHALEHHSDSPEAILAHVPGLKVVIPSSPAEAKGLLLSSIRDPDPVIFMEPKRIYRAIRENVPQGEYTIPLGKARICRQGTDVTLIGWGAMIRYCEHVAEEISAATSVEVIDLRTISPLDRETIISSVSKTGRCVIVHEAPRSGGLGAEISAILNEKAILSLKAPVERVTGFDTVMPLTKLEDHYIPDEFRIKKGIEKVMKF